MPDSTTPFSTETADGEIVLPTLSSTNSPLPKSYVDSNAQLSVLVIEDDDVDFMMISRNLQIGRKRFVLSHAATLAAAIKDLEFRTFDVVLTDLHLPDSFGLGTVKKLRNQCGGVPIIVMTGMDNESVEQEILEAGAQDYLPKGAASSSWTRKAIEHAVQRQRSINRMNHITEQLQASHLLLREQSLAREQENQKLERLYQTAHEFLAKASHDIKGPLTVINEHVSIVRDGLAGRINTQQSDMLGKAMVRADDVNDKLDDLLDSSKLDSGIVEVCRRRCLASDIVDQVRKTLSQRAAMGNVNLEFSRIPSAPSVYCDEQKACRVLTGLGINAINACSDSGRVKVWGRHDAERGHIRIGVTDNGVGIMPQQRELLAARFSRPGLTTEPDDKLLGLGLSIAARFCRLNLGQLHVESEVALGSTFWFDIPTIDSREIFSRWLEMQSEPMRYIQLLSFSVSKACSETEKRDIELLLTYLTQDDELLVPKSPTQWWLASSSSSSDANARLNEAKKEIARLAEVRAASPDFDIQIAECAIWDLGSPKLQIIDSYQNLTC